ncbi:MAG: hypothetical protein U1A27_13115 [Phycisphaerae bacterium]
MQGVEEIANQQADGDTGQDAMEDQLIAHAADGLAERGDDQDLDEVVDRQSEEAVNVALDEPAISEDIRPGHGAAL